MKQSISGLKEKEGEDMGKEEKEGVFLADLERFGYVLRAAERTKEEAKKAIMAEYRRVYAEYNDGEDPTKVRDEMYSDGERSYYEIAEAEVYVRFMPFGKVQWE